MTLKELCSQFTHDANIVIHDITSGKAVTDFVLANKNLCEDIPVENIEIRNDEIYIICIFGVHSTLEREMYEAAKKLCTFCNTKPTLDDCAKCMFFNKNYSKENGSRKSCLIAGIPQYWNF